MNLLSEKELYKIDIEESIKYMDADYFFLGEDLVNIPVFLYKKQISNIPNYEDIKEYFVNAYIVFFNFVHSDFLKFAPVQYNTKDTSLYLNENTFNYCWKYLRRSVQLGINIKSSNDEISKLLEPEDILNLTYMCNDKSVAYIEDQKIKYRSRISDQQDKLYRARQSILDNPKYNFIVDQNHITHYKKCPLINISSSGDITGLEKLDLVDTLCPQCKWDSLLYLACNSNEQMAKCKRILMKSNIPFEDLENAALNNNLCLIKNKNGLEITYNEDTWLIIETNHTYELWHNNYVKTADNARYITNGFHNQHITSNSLLPLWNYITKYDWYSIHVDKDH